jgi:hypothetical protein
MKIKPIRNVKAEFPTLEESLNDKNLIAKSVPNKWKANPVVLAAVGAFVGAGAVFLNVKPNSAPIPKKLPSLDSFSKAQIKIDQINYQLKSKFSMDNAVHKIAPIFIHGYGDSGTGCIAIASPVFISETEAKQVIYNEFLQNGIRLDTNRRLKINASVNYNTKSEDDQNYHFTYAFIQNTDICIDFAGLKTVRDSINYCSRSFSGSSIYQAVCTRNAFIAEDKYHLGVIYENYELDRDDFFDSRRSQIEQQEIKKKLTQKVITNLKLQVCDFIYWAKNEGLIK